MIEVSIKEIKLISERHQRRLLNNIKFEIHPNQIYTILGTNGSGKSTLIKSLTKLLDQRFYSIDGEIIVDEKNILSLTEFDLRKLRQDKVKYVFQDAINGFDPLKKIGYYFKEFSVEKTNVDKLLEYFILPDSKTLFNMYPYELSGGMAQRVSLVLALSTNPQLLILDEPTSGIDTAISNLYLHKLKEFASQENNSVLLVSQDLTFSKNVSDKIAYLNNGTLSEFYDTEEFFNQKIDSSFESFISSYQSLSN